MRRLSGRQARVESLAFSPAGRYLVAGNQPCHAWLIDSGKATPHTVWDGAFYRGFASPTGLLMAAPQSADRLAPYCLWRYNFVTGSSSELDCELDVVVHPGGTHVKHSSPRDGIVTRRVTEAGLGPPLYTPAGVAHGYARPFTYRPQGDIYLIESRQCSGFIYCNASTDEALGDFKVPPKNRSTFVPQFAHDGTRVYVPTHHGILGFDCPTGGKASLRLDGLEPQNRRVLAFQPRGRICAMVDGTRLVTLLDANSLEVVRRYDFAMPKLTAVAFSPDGLVCAVGNSHGKVLLFDVEE